MNCLYAAFKKALFAMDAENARHLSLTALKFAHALRLTYLLPPTIIAPVNVMGLTFTNKLGLAAGLDKDGDYIEALATLGFGFIEIGSVTPLPQSGNTKPRLFRLEKDHAIINRMGFNSKGADYVAERLAKTNYPGILGINLGKNRDTAIENACDDYLIGFRKLWPYASYIAINVSSPNTQNLRDLQQAEALTALIKPMQAERDKIQQQNNKRIPLVVKISPDLTEGELTVVADVLSNCAIDGVIATNTTLSRDNLLDTRYANEIGGLSGRPLTALSTKLIKQLRRELKASIPIIASGGIMDRTSAEEKIAAGAALLQVYTGLVFRGPSLVQEIVNPDKHA